MITDRFNAPRPYANKKHEGLDFAPQRPITQELQVLASQRGLVDKIGFSASGYGNYIRIRHDWGDERWVTWYGHLSEIRTEEGKFVNAGDLIGIAGSTGFSTGVHVHLTVQKIGGGLAGYVVDDVVDPEPLLIDTLPLFDEASWVADVTIPDGMDVEPGQTFLKTWRVRNTGSKTWGSGYTFDFLRGERMNGAQSIALPPAKPGETVDISLNLTAPTTPGKYRGTWQPKAQGVFFPHEQWAEINVRRPDQGQPSDRRSTTRILAGINELDFVEDVTIPDGMEMTPGQTFLKTWRVRNDGTTTWGEGYTFAYFSDERMSGIESVALPRAKPGEEVNITIQFTAPLVPRTYRSTWKGRDPQGKFFDNEQWVEIKVVGDAPSSNAILLAEGFSVRPGTTFAQTWRVRNTGQTRWNENFKLEFVSGERMNAPGVLPIPVANPNDEVPITVQFTAPLTPGLHRGQWRIRSERGEYFGPTLEIVIFVVP